MNRNDAQKVSELQNYIENVMEPKEGKSNKPKVSGKSNLIVDSKHLNMSLKRAKKSI